MALPEGYQFPFNFIALLVVIWGLPPVLLLIGLMIKKPGSPGQFGPAPRGKSIASAALTCLRKSFHFGERASRSEFWWYVLFAFTILGSLAGLVIVKNQTAGMIVYGIMSLPGWAVGTRRLHDIGRSGWWQVLGLTGTGLLVLAVLWALPAREGDDSSVVKVFE